jgi:BirA family biotin operon repressor/biotin-[acetyl-CoA-carboxylase] ligase
VAETLRSYSLPAIIKWPNDVLIDGRKVAGILVESVWNGEAVDCTVIGIGLNVFRPAVPPQEMLQFPATSLEEAMGDPVPPRELILHDILKALLNWRTRLASDDLIAEWEEHLAFRGQIVQVTKRDAPTIRGTLIGLASDGSLLLDNEHGKRITVRFGDVRLRPGE